jgi:hypothetical protein
MMLRGCVVGLLTALLAACGIREPLISIQARGTEFWFRTPDGRVPTILHINVNPVDASWRAVGPVACLLEVKSSGGSSRVGTWTYGTQLPELATQTCRPLKPRSWYRIGVAGSGFGNVLFSTDDQGRVTIRDEP